MDSLKYKKILVYVVMGILSIVGIYTQIIACIYGNSLSLIAETIATCVMFILIAFYAVSNFKVPHGNLLKYLFLVFSVMSISGLLFYDTTGVMSGGKLLFYQALRTIVVVSSAYIAGRLDRIKQNTFLLIIDAILLFVSSIESVIVLKVTDFISVFFLSNFFILWLDLTIAYVFRYYGHKEAGSENKI